MISVCSLNAQNATDSLTAVFELIAKETHVPGFAVAVVNKDKIIYKNGFGFADIESKRPYTTETIQNIGSTSKTVIGLALMKLVDQGKLDLDANINEILPFKVVHPRFPNEPITVRHVAAHTSGIKDSKYYDNSYVLYKPKANAAKHLNFFQRLYFKKLKKNKKESIQSFLQKYLLVDGAYYHKKNFGKTKPGTQYEYTNVGATLGAMIVEVVADEPFEVFTKREFFDPIKMSSTSWSLDEVDLQQHATLYLPKKPRQLPLYSLTTFPDGGLITNVDNLSLYMMELLRGSRGEPSILSKTAFDEMLKNQVPIIGDPADQNTYGIFWNVLDNGYKGHTGSDPGANSIMFFHPENNIGLLMIINMDMDGNKRTIETSTSIWTKLNKYALKFSEKEK